MAKQMRNHPGCAMCKSFPGVISTRARSNTLTKSRRSPSHVRSERKGDKSTHMHRMVTIRHARVALGRARSRQQWRRRGTHTKTPADGSKNCKAHSCSACLTADQATRRAAAEAARNSRVKSTSDSTSARASWVAWQGTVKTLTRETEAITSALRLYLEQQRETTARSV